MEFGVVLPHVGPQARENVVERIQTIARHAEALGYHSVWVADHVVIPTVIESKYPYHPEGKFPIDPSGKDPNMPVPGNRREVTRPATQLTPCQLQGEEAVVFHRSVRPRTLLRRVSKARRSESRSEVTAAR